MLALGGAPLTLGVAPWSHALPAVRAELEARWIATQATPDAFVAHFRLNNLDGSNVVLAFSAAPIRDASGNTTRYVGTAQDITAIATHDRLNDQLVGALDAASDAIVVFDANLQLMFANRGAAEVLGIADTTSIAGSSVVKNNNEAATTFFDAVRNQVPRDVLTGGVHLSLIHI